MEEVVRKMEEPWYANCSLDDVRCFINANLRTAARSAVAVGYYLKQVRDRDLWMDAENAGYTSVWDFAQEEFGISKSTASRYMSINDRFSEGGNSPLIMEKYAELSKSQLQEMLYLTDQQAEEVTPETTVQQIRAMRIPEPGPVEVLDGQMSLSDFLEDAPEPEEQGTTQSAFVVHDSADDLDEVYKAMCEPAVPCVVAMDDLLPEEDAAAAVAISQQDDTGEQCDSLDDVMCDLIPRSDVILTILEEKDSPAKCLEKIKAIPPVSPRRRQGHWWHYEGYLTCSECAMEFDDDIMDYCGDEVPAFCPICGADMRYA